MKTKIANQTWQQGDVYGRKIGKLPDGAQTVIARKKLIVAEGEGHGHQHVIEDDEAELIRIGERILLKLEKQATITHQEHKPITLSPGIWEVGRVKEFDWFSMMERQVID